MKKRLISICMAAMLLVAMSACGTTNTTNTPATTSADAGTDNTAQTTGTIYVSAAASLTESLNKIIETYKADNPGLEIIPTYDSSGTLKTQIESGTDCDIFISAAQKQMDALDGESDKCEGDNFVLAGTRVDLLENQCALVVSTSSDKKITSWDDFETLIKSAKSGSDLTFCMGNSDVPVGQYTSKILTNLGLNEEELANNGVITYGSNVKEVTSQIASGAVDCGIIYTTDAYSADLKTTAIADSALTDGPCIYPAAVMENSANQEAAKAFLDYLKSDAALKVFEEVGFKRVEA